MISGESDSQHSGIVWVFHLDWPTPPGLGPLVAARFVRLGPVDAERLARAMGDRSPAQVRGRLEAGRRCYAAEVEGALAAYGWVSFDEEHVGEMQLRLRLLPGEVYIWDCVTLPAYRRRRLYTALLAHIVGELGAEGLCRAWIGTDAENIASQKGIKLVGFRPVADLTIDRAMTPPMVRLDGRPGVPEPVVAEVRRVFLGDRDRARPAALSAAKRDS